MFGLMFGKSIRWAVILSFGSNLFVSLSSIAHKKEYMAILTKWAVQPWHSRWSLYTYHSFLPSWAQAHHQICRLRPSACIHYRRKYRRYRRPFPLLMGIHLLMDSDIRVNRSVLGSNDWLRDIWPSHRYLVMDDIKATRILNFHRLTIARIGNWFENS